MRLAQPSRPFQSSAFNRADVDDMHEFGNSSAGTAGDWQDHRNESAKQIGTAVHKRWPLHEKVVECGPACINVAKKVKTALSQIDRLLDVFEPGQIALAFNGGKDATVVLHLVMEACRHHPIHKFTHVQPIWFQNPNHEFPEMVSYVRETADQYFTYQKSLKSAEGEKLNRLWTMDILDHEDFIEALVQLAISTGIRCVIMGSRRTDPGCRDLSPLALMDLAPIFLSSTITRMELETKINMLRFEGDPGLPGTQQSSTKEPSLMRFSPTLEWSYRDLWDFIGAAEVPYCSLYEDGYSSIGTTLDTIKNPALLKTAVHRALVSMPTEKAAEVLSGLREAIGAQAWNALEEASARDFKALGVATYDTHYVRVDREELPWKGDLQGEEAVSEEAGREQRKRAFFGPLHSANPNAASSQYWPAWMLQDESEEGASRIQRTNIHSRTGDSASLGEVDMDTAAVLVIGDELMNGEVQESNSHFISSELRTIGIGVKQVMVVENDIDIIAFMIRRLCPIHRYIFVVGGVGPGHGDVTAAAVAKAFGTGMVEHPDLLRMIVGAIPPDRYTEYHWRMAYVPFGAQIIKKLPCRTPHQHHRQPEKASFSSWADMMKDWPVVRKNNCFLFTSKPAFVKCGLESLMPLLSSSPTFSTHITFDVEKSTISREIAETVAAYDKVHMQAFTPDNAPNQRTVVSFASKNYQQQQSAVKMLLEKTSEQYVLSVVDEHTHGQVAG